MVPLWDATPTERHYMLQEEIFRCKKHDIYSYIKYHFASFWSERYNVYISIKFFEHKLIISPIHISTEWQKCFVLSLAVSCSIKFILREISAPAEVLLHIMFGTFPILMEMLLTSLCHEIDGSKYQLSNSHATKIRIIWHRYTHILMLLEHIT